MFPVMLWDLVLKYDRRNKSHIMIKELRANYALGIKPSNDLGISGTDDLEI